MVKSQPLFKINNFISKIGIMHVASRIRKVHPSFPHEKFARLAIEGLEPLELRDRCRHVTSALKSSLPENPKTAVHIIVKAGEEWQKDPEFETNAHYWAALPMIDFLGEHGLHDFETSIDGLQRLTPLFSAEFAIRPFIEKDYNKALRTMYAWRGSRNDLVRRLVSEGSRSKLPWGVKVQRLIDEPKPVLKLLESLKNDPSEFVRRSVANNLNDMSKHHPELVLQVCKRWLSDAGAERKKLVQHALRSLVKAGIPAAHELLGNDPDVKVKVCKLKMAAKVVQVGNCSSFSFDLHSSAQKPQHLTLHYALHFLKQNGRTSPKVFLLKKAMELRAREVRHVSKKFSMRKLRTRKYYPGVHKIEVLVNGNRCGSCDFRLTA
jgi:3-methyladenine DNA glycosylase AlkC